MCSKVLTARLSLSASMSKCCGKDASPLLPFGNRVSLNDTIVPNPAANTRKHLLLEDFSTFSNFRNASWLAIGPPAKSYLHHEQSDLKNFFFSTERLFSEHISPSFDALRDFPMRRNGNQEPGVLEKLDSSYMWRDLGLEAFQNTIGSQVPFIHREIQG